MIYLVFYLEQSGQFALYTTAAPQRNNMIPFHSHGLFSFVF